MALYVAIMSLFQVFIISIWFNTKIVLTRSIITQQKIQYKRNASLQKKSVQCIIFWWYCFKRRNYWKNMMLVERTLFHYIFTVLTLKTLPASGRSSNIRQQKQQTHEKKRKYLVRAVGSWERNGQRSDKETCTQRDNLLIKVSQFSNFFYFN